MEQVFLKIISDIDCLVYVDYELSQMLEKDVMIKIPLRKGEYVVKIVSSVNSDVVIERIISLEYDKVIKADFQGLLESRPELIRNEDIEFSPYSKSYKNKILGKEITGPFYDFGHSFVNGLAIVEQQGKYGCINKYGEEIVKCSYDNVFFKDENIQVLAGDLWGLVDVRGMEVKPCQYIDKNLLLHVIAPFKYDEIIRFLSNRYIAVRQNGKYGMLDLEMREIAPCMYDSISCNVCDDFIKVGQNGKYGIINTRGECVLSCCYDDVKMFYPGWAAVRKGKLWGCVDCRGTEIIPFDYKSIDCVNGIVRIKEPFVEGRRFDKKWGILDENGKIKVDCIYDSPMFDVANPLDLATLHGDYYEVHYDDWSSCDSCLSPDRFVDGRLPVSRNHKYGFIDEWGKEVIPCVYSCAFYFKNGMARVISGNKWCCIDRNANVSLSLECEYLSDFTEGLARVCSKGGKWGYIDVNGTFVVPCDYNRASDFNNGVAAVRIEKTFEVDDRGNEIVKDENRERIAEKAKKNTIFSLTPYEIDSKFVSKTKWRFIDSKGNSLTPDMDLDYDSVTPFNDALWMVRNNGCFYGLVDSKWNEVAPCRYDAIYLLCNDLIEVHNREGKVGLIDISGNEIVPLVYDSISLLCDGLIRAHKDGKSGIIDVNGNEVVPLIYRIISRLCKDLFVVRLNDKEGVINISGDIVVPLVYDSIYSLCDDKIALRLNGRYGIVSFNRPE